MKNLYEIGYVLDPKTGDTFRFIHEGGGIKDTGKVIDILVKDIKVEEGIIKISYK
jgi:hypothetical protein